MKTWHFLSQIHTIELRHFHRHLKKGIMTKLFCGALVKIVSQFQVPSSHSLGVKVFLKIVSNGSDSE